MSAVAKRPGHCAWHRGWADDVVLVTVIEQNSGPGSGWYACLDCALLLAKRPTAPPWLQSDVAAMQERAGGRREKRS